ncbi:16S rRNA (cytosine(967)-C(5))-methyltransferase RsmB [Bacillus sp. EAC]|uniref:16S rRNA (cytosine(967)-C(5))-methyltransferase RsmB n=1 Tax=Bacillus sp. EAC TaxID=1978338 RepID=UPI000B452E24|nr:16S rRNA (cytosine(967)-C(5))-methyltransferase RsmB [Bacillus sp. EAC]
MGKNVREIALEALLSVYKNQSYSNLLVNNTIQKNDLSSSDSGLLTEIIYGTIQRDQLLDFYLEPFIKNQKKLEEWVYILIKLSLYQLHFLDRVPAHAVLNEAVEIAKKRGHKGIASLVNGVLRNIQRNGLRSIDGIKDPIEKLSIETNHPEWLIETWVEEFGVVETRKMCEENILPPYQTARVNLMKASREEVIKMLEDEGIEVEEGNLSPFAIEIQKGNVAYTNAFKEGYLSIQDESSMLVAQALGVSEGEHILDTCAAPGGKSTHIAELLNGTGSVTALDLHKHKVKLIQEQATRLGLENIETKALDARKAPEEFEGRLFDRVLVDAPCSGLGVIRRKPDILLRKNASDVSNLQRVQKSILDEASKLVKPGGTLVYSTCTVGHDENIDVVNSFLNEHNDYELDQSLIEHLPSKLKESKTVQKGFIQLLPHYFGTDGFFIARLRKKV